MKAKKTAPKGAKKPAMPLGSRGAGGMGKRPAGASSPKPSAVERTESMFPQPTQRKIEAISLEEIQPDPHQPRHDVHTRESVTDVLSTLKVIDGVAMPIEAIRLRPAPKDAPSKRRWMIIVGERRYHAAHFAGAGAISAEVLKDISEEEVREMQLVENVARKDLSPLDLADAIAARMKAAGRRANAEELAFRVGLPSARAVYQCVALAALCPAVREALTTGKITRRRALGIATITDHEEQAKALEYLEHVDDRYVARQLEQHYHLRLIGGPSIVGFDVADATLPGGPCESCPKNTVRQRKLWVDEAGDQEEARCTDRACFRGKMDATWERKKTAAEAAGAKVIEGEAAKELYPSQYSSSPVTGAVVDLDHRCEHDEEKAAAEGRPVRTWREVLGEQARPSMVARDSSGRGHELVTLADAAEQLRAVGSGELAELADEVEAEARETEAEQDEAPVGPRGSSYEREKRGREAAGDEALRLILAAASSRETASLWRFVCSLLIFYEVDLGDGMLCEEPAKRRGLTEPETIERGETWAALALRAWLARPESTEAEARELAVEMLVLQGGMPRGFADESDKSSAFLLACRFAGVDWGALVQKHMDEPSASEASPDAEGPEVCNCGGPLGFHARGDENCIADEIGSTSKNDQHERVVSP